MAYVPTNPGFGAAATLAKKKKLLAQAAQKPTGSFDPSGSLGGYSPQQLASMSPDQLAQVQFALGMAGPQQPDFEALQAAALRSAQSSAQPQIDYINQERARQDARQKLSSDAATNFSSAFAQILQGGKTGAEGEQYALENFGGSYLGGIAARMGQQLISQQQDYFNEQDFKLASQLADIMDQIPGEADKIYQDLVSQTQDILTAPYKNQIAAIAALIKNKRDAVGGGGAPEVQNFSDGTSRQWNPKTGKWDVVTTEAGGATKPRVFQTSEGIVAINEATGQVVWEKKTGKAKTTKVTTQVVTQPDGSKTLINKTTGKVISVVAPPDPNAGDTSNGKPPSPSSVSSTVARANDAGKEALAIVLAKIANNFPGSRQSPTIKDANGNEIPNPAFERAKAKYAAWLKSGKSFNSAMARVVSAITPHLAPIGYSKNQIRALAYNIVSARLAPPKGYKVPKASAARVAASKLPAPQSIDFNWLATATTGKGGWADLGGPSAHYAKHDSGENWQSNNAWDISLPVGTPLYAVADGVIGPDVGVQSSRPNDGMRLTLNGQGNAFWYAHLSKIAVKPGQRVKAGQLLGYSGASQNGAAHLHIGVENLGGNYS